MQSITVCACIIYSHDSVQFLPVMPHVYIMQVNGGYVDLTGPGSCLNRYVTRESTWKSLVLAGWQEFRVFVEEWLIITRQKNVTYSVTGTPGKQVLQYK